jgi:uncharacterized membrane protein YoaK (UPF0700 family)
VALLAFLAGAVLGGRLGVAMVGAGRRRWLLTVAGVEAGLLVVAALIAPGYDQTTLAPAERLYALIVLMALAMGIRNATVRQLAVPDMTTTVLTLTLTGLAADASVAGGHNVRWARRIAGVAALFVGAALGAALVNAVGLAPPLLVTAGLVILLTVAYAIHPASKVEVHDAH